MPTQTTTHTPTHLPRYSIIGAGQSNASGLTMYEAVKAMEAAAERGADSAHIRCGARPVGFFSTWHGGMRPMRETLPAERYLLEAWG